MTIDGQGALGDSTDRGQEEKEAVVSRHDLDRIFEALKPSLKMAVLHGASHLTDKAVIHRTHNPRSWKSYESVAQDLAAALKRLGFVHVHTMSEGRGLAAALSSAGIQMAWLNSAGIQGRGPMCHAAAILESLGIPYVGHSPTVAALLDDKILFKQWLQGVGIPTAPLVTWHPSTGFRPSLERLDDLAEASGGPLVVKPVNGRASRHVRWISSTKEAPRAVRWVYGQTKDRVLIEPYLPGREFCIAVAPPILRKENSFTLTSRPRFLTPLERILGKEEKVFASLDFVPIGMSRVKPLESAGDTPILQWLETVAEKIYVNLHLDFLIRLDVREDSHGNLMVLEANPKPDLASRRADGTGSLIALGLTAQGESYDELIACLLARRLAWGLDYCQPSLAAIPDLVKRGGSFGI